MKIPRDIRGATEAGMREKSYEFEVRSGEIYPEVQAPGGSPRRLTAGESGRIFRL